MTSAGPEPGWYFDPDGGENERYWNGIEWTQHRRSRRSTVSQPPESSSRPADIVDSMSASLKAGTPTEKPVPGRRRSSVAYYLLFTVLAVIAVVTGVIFTQTHGSEARLDGLLLDAAAVNTAMQTSGMTVTRTGTNMAKSPSVADKNCAAVAGPAGDAVYSGSGWTGVAAQELTGGNDTVDQSVITFPSANDASKFYAASSRSWSACSNRRFTARYSDSQCRRGSRSGVRREWHADHILCRSR